MHVPLIVITFFATKFVLLVLNQDSLGCKKLYSIFLPSCNSVHHLISQFHGFVAGSFRIPQLTTILNEKNLM